MQSAESNSKNIRKLNSSQGIQVIARAAEILRALKADNEGLSLGQIATRVGLPRSTVQRIVNALIAERLVMSSMTKGGLKLGPEIHSLALAARVDVAEVVRPVLTQLSQQTGETVDLAVFRDDQLVFIDQAIGTHRLRTVSAVGEVFPLTDTANGKAVLAMLDEDIAATLICAELGVRKDSAKLSVQLESELKSVRTNGYALDIGEHTQGISAVGAAFRDRTRLIYAISIPVPSQRFEGMQAELITALQHAVVKTKDVLG